jgi:hypothetical protein
VVSRYISPTLRQAIAEESQFLCGYCQTAQKIVGLPLVIDHIVPVTKGGLTVRDNLWLACRRCNEFKGAKTEERDPVSGLLVPLYNPRRQSWAVHFAWDGAGTKIVGLTAVGRATVIALRLNNEEIVGARSLWVSAGWHPPR